jgi:branched-chain amino acid transport system substrate-binding protein
MRAGFSRAAVAVVLLAAGYAKAPAQTEGISDGTVKIGVLTDMAGVFSDLAGAGAVMAAQMAIDDFIEKEKPSFKVELVSADHQNKPDIATGIARQWYDTGNVDMITDVINSGVALAVSSVAESKNRMLIVTGSGSTRLTNEHARPTPSVTPGTPIPSPTASRASSNRSASTPGISSLWITRSASHLWRKPLTRSHAPAAP